VEFSLGVVFLFLAGFGAAKGDKTYGICVIFFAFL